MDSVHDGNVNRFVYSRSALHATYESQESEMKDFFEKTLFSSDNKIVIKKDFSSSSLLSDPYKSCEYVVGFDLKVGLSPDDINAKRTAMKESPLSFFRAAPSLFFKDINSSYSSLSKLLPEPPQIYITGDMHLGNFGVLKDPKGLPVWGINDFDQGAISTPEYDLERLAVSFILKAGLIGASSSECEQLIKDISEVYVSQVKKTASSSISSSPYLKEAEASPVIASLLKKALEKDQKKLLKKYTQTDGLNLKLKRNEELCNISPEVMNKVEKALSSCVWAGDNQKLEIIDMAEKKGSGGSSYGLGRFWTLAKTDQNALPVIIELKKLLPSSVIDQEGDLSKASGKEVINTQKSLGGLMNPLTGYTKIDGFDYLVRERESVKSSIDLDDISELTALKEIAKNSAQVLANAHCANPQNAVKLERWLEGKADKLASSLYLFSEKYSEQIKADYDAFCSGF